MHLHIMGSLVIIYLLDVPNQSQVPLRRFSLHHLTVKIVYFKICLSFITGPDSYIESKMQNLPEVRKPFDQLGGVVLVKLDVREVHFENGRRRVSDPEEHQLGFPQVHGRQRCRVWKR